MSTSHRSLLSRLHRLAGAAALVFIASFWLATIIVGVAYGEDVDAAREVIRTAIEGLETRAPGAAPEVFAREFNSSSIDFLVRWWAKSAPPDEHRSRDEAVAAVKRALDEAGIEIPFPYRTLTFKEPLALDRTGDET